MTPTDEIKPYSVICVERRAAFRERVTTMQQKSHLRGQLIQWANKMTARFNSTTVKVWANELPWLDALGVVRYGEAIDHWPLQWSEDDVRRANRWFDLGETPNGVTYLPAKE